MQPAWHGGSETLSFALASPSRQTALIFSSPHGSLRIDQRSAKIRECIVAAAAAAAPPVCHRTLISLSFHILHRSVAESLPRKCFICTFYMRALSKPERVQIISGH